jgi:hypothetical protein
VSRNVNHAGGDVTHFRRSASRGILPRTHDHEFESCQILSGGDAITRTIPSERGSLSPPAHPRFDWASAGLFAAGRSARRIALWRAKTGRSSLALTFRTLDRYRSKLLVSRDRITPA